MRLTAIIICLCTALTACSESNSLPVQSPASSSSVTYAGNSRTLNAGIVDIIGENYGHYRIDIQLSDGTFQIALYTLQGFLYSYWFSPDDTVSFSADLYAASSDSFSARRFEYVDINQIRSSDDTLGRSVFSQANVGWDFNSDGNVDDDEELDIVAGTIDVTGSEPTELHLSFDVLLSDGQRASGAYVGVLVLVD